MKKQLLVISALMLVGTLASCGGGNHNPGAVSDSTINPSTTSAETTSEGTSTTSEGTSTTSEFTPEVTYPLLTVHLYQRYVDNDCSASLKKQFEDELVNQKAAVTKLNWVMGTGAQNEGVADYSADLGTYDAAHPTETIDVVLGAKANFAEDSYIVKNFATLKKADGSGNVTMSTTNGETTKTDRYIWIRNNTANLEALKVLLKGIVDYDWPEPVDPTSETTSEEPTSETTSETTSEETPSETTSETTSESEPVVLPALTVHLYAKFVNLTCSGELKAKFTKYLTDNNITITSLAWELGTETGKGSLYATEVENYDKAHTDATADVLLGIRGGIDNTYISTNFAIAQVDSKDVLMTTTSDSQGTKADRYIFVRNGSANDDAIGVLVLALGENLN